MKSTIFTLLAFLSFTRLLGQTLETECDNCPAVISKNFSATYGVRADAIEAILWIYEAEGYELERRKRATEQILREYAQAPEKKQKTDELSEATRRKLGIANAPKVANALEWDLFARNHYLSTAGSNSPAVLAKGDVNIWYGIPPKALRALAAQLEKHKTDFASFETKLAEQAKKYEELKAELKTYGAKEAIYRQAEALLEEGKLEEAERLIESDFAASMKRQAYKGYIYGTTKALLLKYDEAAKGYKNAVDNDGGNSTYHLSYAYNEKTLAHHDEAIKHLEIALGIDSLESGNQEGVSNLLNNIGLVWCEKGIYDKSILYYEKALKIDVETLNQSHPKIAVRYNNLGFTWHLKGAYDKATAYYEKALQINLKAFGDQHPDIAVYYNNMGLALHSKGIYDKAIEHYEKALQIDLEIFGENHPKIASRYNNLGMAWRSKGEYDKAIDYHGGALQIASKTFGENHPDIATGYNNLGMAWHSKGEYDKAIDCYEKALQIASKTFGENHPDIATGYNNLGMAWHSKGEHDKAIDYYEKALQVFLKNFDQNHPHLATAYNNLGATCDSKGEYDKAIDYYESALQIALKTFGENHPKIAVSYNNLGMAWRSKGEYDKAIDYHGRALQIASKTFGENHPDIATGYNNLGMAWHSKGEYDKAIDYYEKALQISLKAFGETHPSIAIEYNNLGTAWNAKGEHEKAIEYHEKALQIDLQAFGENHPNVATGYNNLGGVCKEKGEYDKAIAYFERALQIDLKVLGENHPSVIVDYNNLGKTWQEKGEYDKAIGCYERCQTICDRFFPSNHYKQKAVASSLSLAATIKGMELASKENYKEALPYFLKAEENVRKAKDEGFGVICLLNIGATYKHLKNYEEGLQNLDAGLQKVAQLHQEIDQVIKDELTPEMLANPDVQAKIAELKNFALIRRMQYHKVGCLKGLKRNKEADALARQLWQEGAEANDARLLEDLRKEGYDFGK